MVRASATLIAVGQRHLQRQAQATRLLAEQPALYESRALNGRRCASQAPRREGLDWQPDARQRGFLPFQRAALAAS